MVYRTREGCLLWNCPECFVSCLGSTENQSRICFQGDIERLTLNLFFSIKRFDCIRDTNQWK